MRIGRIFTILLISIVFIQLTLTAQLLKNDEDALPDSVCFKYKFRAGDTLVYHIEAFDSIIIDYSPTLLKHRFEELQIVCDSVSAAGIFYLQLETKALLSKEKTKNEEAVRETSPWLGRKVFLAIDSVGRRLIQRPDDSTKAAMAPGGPFQPLLLLPFGQTCKRINESWLVKKLDTLVENGVPAAVLNHTSLFRAKEPVDTLGRYCLRFEYIRTSQGSVVVITENEQIGVTSVNNEFGKMLIDTVFNIPVHFFTTIEQKLQIIDSEGIQKPGWHFIYMNYTLHHFTPGEERKMLPAIPRKRGKH